VLADSAQAAIKAASGSVARAREEGEGERYKSSAHARNGTTPEALERFVRNSGFRLEPDDLEHELRARGADADRVHELRDLAADLRRGEP
jgi:hypothetical protein